MSHTVKHNLKGGGTVSFTFKMEQGPSSFRRWPVCVCVWEEGGEPG